MRWLGRVPLQLRLLAVVLVAWLAADRLALHDIATTPAYRYATSLLLAIGLYGSTFGIDRAMASQHKRLIFTAVTVGVLLKATLIGGVLFLITRDPLFIVLGVAVAQIDPLSVAAIMDHEHRSPRVKSILAAWASFDDPVTVILVVYASAIATGSFGLGHTGAAAQGIGGYGLDLALNLAFAAVAYLAWRALRSAPAWLAALVLVGLAAVAVWQFLMLGVAIAGLFVRPAWLAPLVGRITTAALFVAGALLGILLVGGVNVGFGVLLGLMAFAAQVVAGALLSRGLARTDRLHLALAQQNGITAIILALRLEVTFAGVVAIVAPAILVTNAVHFVANWLADGRRHSRAQTTAEPRGDATRLRHSSTD
jgi:hypothetical protein